MEDKSWTRMRQFIVCYSVSRQHSELTHWVLVIFLGINDCGTTEGDELDTIVENIFDALHHLYVKAGARNLILFDIPPIDRSPQGTV